MHTYLSLPTFTLFKCCYSEPRPLVHKREVSSLDPLAFPLGRLKPMDTGVLRTGARSERQQQCLWVSILLTTACQQIQDSKHVQGIELRAGMQQGQTLPNYLLITDG